MFASYVDHVWNRRRVQRVGSRHAIALRRALVCLVLVRFSSCYDLAECLSGAPCGHQHSAFIQGQQLSHDHDARRQLGDVRTVDVSDAQGLMAALSSPDVANIRIVSASLSTDTVSWQSLEAPLNVSRDVVLLGGGRYGASGASTSTTGPYHVLDFGRLVGKIQLAARNNATTAAQLQFRGLRLLRHMPPTGYGLPILSSSGGALVLYEDCVLERDVGLPLASVAAEAQAAVMASEHASANIMLTALWCPPAPLQAQPQGCLTNGAILFKEFTVSVTVGVVPALLETNGPSPAGPLDSVSQHIVLTFRNCTYGVRYEVLPACVSAYGAEYCIYQLQTALWQEGSAERAGVSAGVGAGIAVAATVAAFMALLLLIRFVRRVRGGHRTLTLAVRPPGATPLTTLLVTDIQDSTLLWEALPTAVMNEALRLHHKCLRSFLPKCNGYESATEGDSFILAFHTPMDAARFALLAQHALTELPWPSELLDHPAGCEVWAEPSKPKIIRGSPHGWALGLVSSVTAHHTFASNADDESDDDDASAVLCDTSGAAHTSHWWLPASLGSPSRTGARRAGHVKGASSALRKPVTPRPSMSERPLSGALSGGQHLNGGAPSSDGFGTIGTNGELNPFGSGAGLSPFTTAGIKPPADEDQQERVARENTAPPLPFRRIVSAVATRGASFDSQVPVQTQSPAAAPTPVASCQGPPARSRGRHAAFLDGLFGDGDVPEGAGSLLTSLTLRFMSRSNSNRASSSGIANVAGGAAADGASPAFTRCKAVHKGRSPTGSSAADDPAMLSWTSNPVAALASAGSLPLPAEGVGGTHDGTGIDDVVWSSGANAALAAPGSSSRAANKQSVPGGGAQAKASPADQFAANMSLALAPAGTTHPAGSTLGRRHGDPYALLSPPFITSLATGAVASRPKAATEAVAGGSSAPLPRPGPSPVAEGAEGQHSSLALASAKAGPATADSPSRAAEHALGSAASAGSLRALLRNASYSSSAVAPAVPSRLGPRHGMPHAPAHHPGPDGASHIFLRLARSSELTTDSSAPGNIQLRHTDAPPASGTTELQLQQLLPASGELLNPCATNEMLSILQAAASGHSAGPPAADGLTAVAARNDPLLSVSARSPMRAASEKGSLLRMHLSADSGTAQALARPLVSAMSARKEAQFTAVQQLRGMPAGSVATGPASQQAADLHNRGRAHTYHGYQQERPVGSAARMSHTAITAGADTSSVPPNAPLPRAGASSRSLNYSRTQAIEMVPLPAKVPEVRQTWREMCASHWLLLPSTRGAARVSSKSLDLPQHGSAGRPLEPHPEAEGDDNELQPYGTNRHQYEHPSQQHSPSPHHHGQGGVCKAHKGAALLFRGVRVRMGLHAGIPLTTDVAFNHTTGHMAYSGMPLKIAKAVGDSAAGGSVLLSNTAFNQVHPHLADLPGHARLLFCGDAQVELVIRSLYMLVDRDLQPRLGHLPPLRNLRMVQLGNFEAPVGTVAICFMTIAGATKAVAELGQPAVSALQEFKTIVTFECRQCGGFVVEATDGLCLAAFMEPAGAAIWALRCKEVLMAHSWSREVLASPHFREVREASKIQRGRGLRSRRVTHVVCRGPRIRCGIAVGPATAEVSAATARLSYRGKVMNRSARVAAQAVDNQVLLSEAAWQRLVATVGVHGLVDPMTKRRETLQWQASDGSSPSGGMLLAAALANAPSGHGSAARVGAPGGGNPLWAAAEHLLSSTVEEGDVEDAEALVTAARATCSGLPALPAGYSLVGSSAGVFALKGVPEPQELYEVHIVAVQQQASGTSTPQAPSLSGSRLPSFAQGTQPSFTGRAAAVGAVQQQQLAAGPHANRAAAGAPSSRLRQLARSNGDAANVGTRQLTAAGPTAAHPAAMPSSATAGSAFGSHDAATDGATSDRSSEQLASREASVIGQLDPSELSLLRTLALAGQSVEHVHAAGGAASDAAAEALVAAAPASASAEPGAKGAAGSSLGEVRTVKTRPRKPLAGDALLDILVQAALGADDTQD